MTSGDVTATSLADPTGLGGGLTGPVEGRCDFFYHFLIRMQDLTYYPTTALSP